MAMDVILFCMYVLIGLRLGVLCVDTSSRALTKMEELSVYFMMALFWPIALLGFAIVALAVLFGGKNG